MQTRIRSRLSVLLAITAIGVLTMILGGQSLITAAPQSNFVGGDPTRPNSSDMRALRLRFEAGARSNWHSHAGWQILAAEEGQGRTQVRGEPIVELLPGGQANFTAPGVVHWHGASPDAYAIQLTIMGGSTGDTSWLEPVSNADYRGQ
jgi:quercetin dioxygenase-like cupin family protein